MNQHLLLRNLVLAKGLVFYAVQNKTKSLTNGARGSIVKFITKGDVESIFIPIPIDHKDNFYDVLNTIFNEIDMLDRENDKLVELRGWLLPMLMSGQVTIKEP